MIVLNQKGDILKEVKKLEIKSKEVPANDDTKMYFNLVEQLGRKDFDKPENYETKEVYCLVDESGEELGVYEHAIEPLTILNSIIECKENYRKL